MFASNSKQSDLTAATLGVWISPGLGMGFPELKGLLQNLYRDKVSRLDFVPSGWYDAVKKLQDSLPNDLVRIAPSQMQNGSPIDDMPEWVTETPTINNAWQSLFKATNEVVSQYAQQQQSKGKAELERLQANARFWDTAYKIGKATGIADVQSGVQNVKDFWAENQTNMKVVGVVVGILAALWVLAPYFVRGK